MPRLQSGFFVETTCNVTIPLQDLRDSLSASAPESGEEGSGALASLRK
jgi:hypothetical protein